MKHCHSATFPGGVPGESPYLAAAFRDGSNGETDHSDCPAAGVPREIRVGRSAGLTLSDLVRRSVRRTRTWTVAHAEVERERTQQAARVGDNLNQIARWANTHKEAVEAVEVIGHLIAIKRPT